MKHSKMLLIARCSCFVTSLHHKTTALYEYPRCHVHLFTTIDSKEAHKMLVKGLTKGLFVAIVVLVLMSFLLISTVIQYLSSTDSARIYPRVISYVDLKAENNRGEFEAQGCGWSNFVSLQSLALTKNKYKLKLQWKPKWCNTKILSDLHLPRLTTAEHQWCQKANEIQLKSKLPPNLKWNEYMAQLRNFSKLSCQYVTDKNLKDSCSHLYGDEFISDWKDKSKLKVTKCDTISKSSQVCRTNQVNQTYCELTNAMINFAGFKPVTKVNRRGKTFLSKSFQHDFISIDCQQSNNTLSHKHPATNAAHLNNEYHPLSHLYSQALSSHHCDYTHQGTVLLYSHDYVINLGHTLNDMLNVWLMLHLGEFESQSSIQDVSFLNIDAINGNFNWNDSIASPFFSHYRRNFRNIYSGAQFTNKTVCIRRLLLPPEPGMQFIFDGWNHDIPCTFVGPSAIYQRFNYQIRQSYGLLSSTFVNKRVKENRIRILFIYRHATENLYGSSQTSRNILNMEEVETALRDFAAEFRINNMGDNKAPKVDIVVQDLNVLCFEQQVALIADTSIILGAHGAGITHSLHMSVGEPNCCGVVEIFPHGEFTPIRGHGNVARHLGIHYDRIDIDPLHSSADGATVSTSVLLATLSSMVISVVESSSCILPSVVKEFN